MDNTNGGPIDQNINPDLISSQGDSPTLGTPLATTTTNKPIDITPTDTPTPVIAPITELTPVGSHLSDIAGISNDSPIHEVISAPIQTPTITTPAPAETPTLNPLASMVPLETMVTPTPQIENTTPEAAPVSLPEPLVAAEAPAPASQVSAVPFAEDPNLVKTI